MGYLNIAPPPPCRPAWRDAGKILRLGGEGFPFTTQVVTLWCFNTVATRRSAAPGPRITDRPRRRGARRHRLTAGAAPRAPRAGAWR